MSPTALRRDKPLRPAGTFHFLSHPYFWDFLIALLTFFLIFLLILACLTPERYELKAGDIPGEPIAAPRDIADEKATRERREYARERVNDIYTLDQMITKDVVSGIDAMFHGMDSTREAAAGRTKKWDELRENSIKAWEEAQRQDLQSQQTPAGPQPTPLPEKPDDSQLYDEAFFQEVQKMFPAQLAKDDILMIIKADPKNLDRLRQELTNTVRDMLRTGIKQEQLSGFKVDLREAVQEMEIPDELKSLGITIGISQLKANLLYDPEKTQEEKQKAADNVEEVVYKRGQFIAQAGQPVTKDQITMLAELGLLKDDKVDVPLFAGIALSVFSCLVLSAFYVIYFEKELLQKPLILLMISTILCLVLGVTYFTSRLNFYLIPAAMAGMLLTVLLNARIGIVFNMITALLVGLMYGMQLPPVILTAFGGMVGICLLRSIQQRNSLVWAGLGIAAGNMLAAASSELLTAGGGTGLFISSLWGALGGLIAAVLATGTLPVWENLFGIVTPMKLVELSNPNQPILKRLLVETPGTYHHSVIVANLAERAADAIGANGLLARVGSYYHDIGKLERPYYFRENQLYEDNPHDRLDPMLSTRIITSHVTDGIKLAKKYNVPPVLYDFILQHHGTTPVVYFYHKAKNNSHGDPEVRLNDFRYPGPRPSSRESAIVMMADTTEAAVRAMTDHTPDKVEERIRTLMREKLDDGQFANCDLTIKDMNVIASTFARVITGIFHDRVKYPEIDLKEERENH